LQGRQAGHDVAGSSLLDRPYGCRIALRRRKARLADMIDRLAVLPTLEERHCADYLRRLPKIGAAALLAKAAQKCPDRRRGDGVVQLHPILVIPLQPPRSFLHVMRTNSSRHDPDCGAANGLGGTRATEIAALYGQLRAVHLRTRLATRASLTEIQLAKYQTLRGYDAVGANPVHKH